MKRVEENRDWGSTWGCDLVVVTGVSTFAVDGL